MRSAIWCGRGWQPCGQFVRPASNCPASEHDVMHRVLEPQAGEPSPVPILTLDLDVEGAAAEASDGGEDVVCGLGPADRLWIGVAGVDVGGDGGLQRLGGAVGTTPDLLFGEECKEAARPD